MPRPLKLIIEVDDQGTPVLRQFEGQVQRTASQVRGSQSRMEQGFTRVNQKMERTRKLSDLIGRTFGTMRIAGFRLTLGMGVLATALGIATTAMTVFIKQAAAWETQMKKVEILVDRDARPAIAQLGRTGRLVAIEFGQSLDAVGKSLFDFVSAGFSAAETSKLIYTAARLAEGGLTDLDNATSALISSLRAMRLEVEDAEQAAAFLFETARLGRTDVQQVAEQIADLLPIAKTAGVNLETVGAALATVTLAGFSTADAVTRLSGLFLSLTAPTVENARELQNMGIQVFRLRDGTIDLVKTLQQFQGMDLEMIRRLLGTKEAVTAMAALLNNMDRLQKMLQDMPEAPKRFDEAVKIMHDNTSNRLSRIWALIKDIGLSIGEWSKNSILFQGTLAVTEAILKRIANVMQRLAGTPLAALQKEFEQLSVAIAASERQAQASQKSLQRLNAELEKRKQHLQELLQEEERLPQKSAGLLGQLFGQLTPLEQVQQAIANEQEAIKRITELRDEEREKLEENLAKIKEFQAAQEQINKLIKGLTGETEKQKQQTTETESFQEKLTSALREAADILVDDIRGGARQWAEETEDVLRSYQSIDAVSVELIGKTRKLTDLERARMAILMEEIQLRQQEAREEIILNALREIVDILVDDIRGGARQWAEETEDVLRSYQSLDALNVELTGGTRKLTDLEKARMAILMEEIRLRQQEREAAERLARLIGPLREAAELLVDDIRGGAQQWAEETADVLRSYQSMDAVNVEIVGGTKKLTDLEKAWIAILKERIRLRQQEGEEAKRAAQEALEEWKRKVEGVNQKVKQTLTDFFTGILEGGRNAFDALKRMFLRTLAEMAAAAATKLVIRPVLQFLGLAAPPAAAAAALAAGGTAQATQMTQAVTQTAAAAQAMSQAAQATQTTAQVSAQAVSATGQAAAQTAGATQAAAQASEQAASAAGKLGAMVQTAMPFLQAGALGLVTGMATSQILGAVGVGGKVGAGISGAIGGATTGALIGSMFGVPFLGGAIGFLGGALLGAIFGGGKQPKFPRIEFGQPEQRPIRFQIGANEGRLQLEQMQLDIKTVRIGKGQEVQEAIQSRVEELFDSMLKGMNTLDEEVRTTLVPGLQDAADQFAEAISNTRLEGENIKEQLEELLGEVLPAQFEEIFRPFLQLPAVAGSIDDQIQRIEELNMSAMQIFDRRRQELEDALRAFEALAPEEQLAGAAAVQEAVEAMVQAAEQAFGERSGRFIEVQEDAIEQLQQLREQLITTVEEQVAQIQPEITVTPVVSAVQTLPATTVSATTGLRTTPTVTLEDTGGFQGGIGFVPRDMVAQLHRGERVVPVGEALGSHVTVQFGDINVSITTTGDGVSTRTAADLAQALLPELRKAIRDGGLNPELQAFVRRGAA